MGTRKHGPVPEEPVCFICGRIMVPNLIKRTWECPIEEHESMITGEALAELLSYVYRP